MAIIVPMLDIDNILSKGVGPLIARTKHNATETPRTIKVAKKNHLSKSVITLFISSVCKSSDSFLLNA